MQAQIKKFTNSCFEVVFGISYDMYHHESTDPSGIKQAEADSVVSYTYQPRPGFQLGFLKSFEITDRFLVRTGLTASYHQCFYDYTATSMDSYRGHYKMKSQVLAFTVPLHGIYQFKRAHKDKSTYPYALAGGFYSYQTQTGSEPRNRHNATNIAINSHQMGVDIGIGARIFTRQGYLMAPELKYRIGLLNMKADYNDPYNQMFNRLMMQSLILTLHFS